MSHSVRILHLDHGAASSERIRSELERNGLKVTIERAGSHEEFSSALRRFLPEVVLSDMVQSHGDIRAALNAVQLFHPTAPLILIPCELDEQLAVLSLRAGAEDIVLKRNLTRLGPAIEAALAVRRRLKRLTPRQLEVLRLVAGGHTTREIARRLKLSAKTVESHRGEIMKRLGIHDVVGLVRYAIRVGMVPHEA